MHETHSTTTHHFHHHLHSPPAISECISTERADILLKHEARHHLVETQPKRAQGGLADPTTWLVSLLLRHL